MSELKWTNEPPRELGWYWYRSSPQAEARPVLVRRLFSKPIGLSQWQGPIAPVSEEEA